MVAMSKSALLSPYKPLLDNGNIRGEFKSNDDERGQIRIHLLHNRVSTKRAPEHARTVRKAYKHLFRNLDLSKAVWNGQWTDDTPVHDLTYDSDDSTEDKTLLSLFNDLPSPRPSFDKLFSSAYAQDTMGSLLEGNVHGLVTNMYPYQRRSAALMLQREVKPGLLIDPRLKALVDQNGAPWFCDPDDSHYARTARMYDAPRGGILAENMGLGKTLICLGLIMATRAQSSTIPPENSLNLVPVRKSTGSLLEMSAAAVNRHAVPWKDEFVFASNEGVEYTRARNAIKSQPGHYFVKSAVAPRTFRTRSVAPPLRKIFLSTTTLVVVPSNLLQQWINEINKHTETLHVLVMKDTNTALPDAVELLEYDIILFTKSRFDKEAKSGIETSPLMNVHFKRIIYDEGHTFGSASSSSPTESFVLMNTLRITARWIISGSKYTHKS